MRENIATKIAPQVELIATILNFLNNLKKSSYLL